MMIMAGIRSFAHRSSSTICPASARIIGCLQNSSLLIGIRFRRGLALQPCCIYLRIDLCSGPYGHSPSVLHRRLKYADRLPLFQMIAKNVGIRRAKGQFVLATNIDILFSDELIAIHRSTTIGSQETISSGSVRHRERSQSASHVRRDVRLCMESPYPRPSEISSRSISPTSLCERAFQEVSYSWARIPRQGRKCRGDKRGRDMADKAGTFC